MNKNNTMQYQGGNNNNNANASQAGWKDPRRNDTTSDHEFIDNNYVTLYPLQFCIMQ